MQHKRLKKQAQAYNIYSFKDGLVKCYQEIIITASLMNTQPPGLPHTFQLIQLEQGE